MLCMSILSNIILELLGKIIGFISHTVPLQGLIIAKKDEKKHILNATNLTAKQLPIRVRGIAMTLGRVIAMTPPMAPENRVNSLLSFGLLLKGPVS